MGRATTFGVGLAVVLALTLTIVAGTAEAAKAKSLKAGVQNTVKAVTSMVGSVAGPVLRLDNNSTASNATALDLQVESGKAPMTVNSDTKVGNLNADKIDGKSSEDLLAADGKAADSDELDGQDSTAFGIKTDQKAAPASGCDTPGTSNECAPVTVTVPDGKTYAVSVWSSFSARGDTLDPNVQEQNVFFCSAGRNPDQTTPQCITPSGLDNAVTVEVNKIRTGASSGETLSEGPGTYTFSTRIRPDAQQFAPSGQSEAVITKVLVRDVSTSLP